MASGGEPAASGSLPIIDVSGLSASDPSLRAAVGQAIRAACLDKGFFYCGDHGVPAGLVDAVFAECRRFLEQPLAIEQQVDKAHSTCNRGYEPLGGQTLQPGAQPDQKKGPIICRHLRSNRGNSSRL